MQLSWQQIEHPRAIHALEGSRLRLGDTWHDSSVWVDASGSGPWRPRNVEALQAEDLEQLLLRGPALLLLGTGPRLEFPSAQLRAIVLSRGIGLECMDNAAAARTYNVLLGEGRAVLAAFLQEPLEGTRARGHEGT